MAALKIHSSLTRWLRSVCFQNEMHCRKIIIARRQKTCVGFLNEGKKVCIKVKLSSFNSSPNSKLGLSLLLQLCTLFPLSLIPSNDVRRQFHLRKPHAFVVAITARALVDIFALNNFMIMIFPSNVPNSLYVTNAAAAASLFSQSSRLPILYGKGGERKKTKNERRKRAEEGRQKM